MTYRQVEIGLSKKQKESIARALEAGSSVRIKLSNKHLLSKGTSFLATKTQFNKMERAKKSKKGVVITLSKKQLHAMKVGGFLPMLLAGLASSLAPVIFNRIFPDKSQGGEGINMPGAGFIAPANGENTSYHVKGFSAKNAGAGSGGNPGNPNGQGLVLPGTKTAQRYGKQLPQQAQGVKKKRQMRTVGMGFIDPMSEKFQMLS